MKNFVINKDKTYELIINNDKIILKNSDYYKEVIDQRLANDINDYNEIVKIINQDIQSSTNNKKDKLNYLLLLLNLLNTGALGIALFNSLFTLTFIFLPIEVILLNIKKIVKDGNRYYEDRINVDENLLLELEEIESRLDQNIIDRFENEEDFSHYVVYTEQDLAQVKSKYLTR